MWLPSYFEKYEVDDNRVLQQDTFRTLGSIVELFSDNMDMSKKIMGVIADINRNSEEVV